MEPINIVPIQRDDYSYCCVFPIEPVTGWTQSLQAIAKTAVLLEYDLEDGPALSASWLGQSHQDWPPGTVHNAKLGGAHIRFDQRRVPEVSREILRPPPNSTIHYLSLALMTEQAQTMLSDWTSAREEIVASYLPDRWPAPRGCQGILHAFESNYVALLSPNNAITVHWLADILRTRFHLIIDRDTAKESGGTVSRWILGRAQGQGICISELSNVLANGQFAVRVVGHWGRDPDFALSVGAAGGDPLEQILSLEGVD